jgi:hypothetical protein
MKIKSYLDLIFNQIFKFFPLYYSNKKCQILFLFYGKDTKQILLRFSKFKMVYIKTVYLQSHLVIKNNGKMLKLVLT